MRNKPSHMFLSSTLKVAEPTPGPQDYTSSINLLNKKDFSRPHIVHTSPVRNTDGAIRTELYVHSNELKYKNLSPGPAPALDFPGLANKDRQRTDPRMHQYGLNMITNTLQDPDQVKSNNEMAKA
jgi:hypothetical protein